MNGNSYIKRYLGSTALFILLFAGTFFSTVTIVDAAERCWYDRGGIQHCSTDNGDGTTTSTTNYGGTVHTQTSTNPPDIIAQGAQFVGNVALSAILLPVVAISLVILTFASGLLWLAGVIFNWTVTVLVFQFAVYLGNTPGMLLAWGILRDFGNILLLFGFVYMGIQTILQIGHYSVGRALSRLVIFAVLLNFSLFVAEAVIDTSNVLAASMYSLSGSTSVSGEACRGDQLSDCSINQGIASKILNQAGIGTVLGGVVQSGLSGAWNYITNPVGETLKYLMLAMIVTVMAVVLFAGAFLLISRGVHLAFLMVTAPVGFAGMAVPWLEKIAKDWWDQLIKQSLFAPVFLILLFVGLKIMEGVSTGIGGGSLVEAMSTAGALNTGPIIIFVLIIGFMIGAMLVAKQFGIYGAEAITKTALGAIKGVASYPFTPYRDFAGRQAENFAKRYNAASGRRMGRLDEWAKKSGLLGTLAKPVLSAAGSAIDDGVMSSVKGVKDFKVGSRSYADQKKHMDEREKEMADAARQAKQKKDLDDAISSGNTDNIERLLQQMSTQDIKATSYIKESKDGIGEIARSLSTDRFAELINDKEVGEATKKKLMDERFSKLTDALANHATTPADTQKEVRKWSGKDLDLLAKGKPADFESMIKTYNTDGTDVLSDAQIEHLEKSTTLTNGQRQVVKQNTVVGRMSSGLTTTGPGVPSPAAVGYIMGRMKAKQKAKLSDEALREAANRSLLNTSDFAQIQARGEINDSTRRHIATHIQTVINDPTHPNQPAYEKYMKSHVAEGYWTP